MSLPWRFSIRDSTVKTAAAPSRSPSEDSHHQKHTSTRHPGTDETSQQPPETPGSSGGRRQQKPGGPSSCSLRPPITRPSSGPPLSGYHLGAKPGGLCFGGEVCSRSSPRAPHLPAPGLRGAASPSPPPCRAAGPRSCLFFFFLPFCSTATAAAAGGGCKETDRAKAGGTHELVCRYSKVSCARFRLL